MANFFPAASRIDVPSLNRRAQSRNTLREAEAGSDTPSDGRQSRPSHINWLPTPSTTTQQAGPPMPRRPPSVRLGRSASLSALGGSQPTLHRQSSLISNHSLQLDKPAGSAHPAAAQLSPISERSYIPTPKREQIFTDVEPSTPVSIGESKWNLHFGRARVIRILLHTCRYFLFRLLAETPEAVDLRNLDELPSHKRNIHPSAYPPALESLTIRASPGVPSRVPPCGPTARLDRIRRRRLGAHRQLRHRAFRRNQRRGRQRGVAGRPRSLVLHHSLLTNSRALRQPIRPARRL